MPLRVGIVGTGLLGARHADRWSKLPVILEGFFDTDPAKSRQVADAYGGRMFSSLDDLARSVDIVHISSPTPFHKEGVLAAAAHHKAVFCEKPLARYPADASAMIAACEQGGSRLYVGQTLRFFGQYMQAKHLLDEGFIGKPALLRLTRGAGSPAGLGGRSWLGDVAQSGGAIMEGGIHDLDFARWCFGDVDHVFARGTTFREEYNTIGDHVLVTLRFTSGAIGQVEGNWTATDGRLRQQYEIVGTQGLLTYDSHASEQLMLSPHADKRIPALALPAQGPLAIQDDPYYLQLEHFLNALIRDQEFRVSPQDGLEAVRLCVAALESVWTGRVIRMEEVE